MSESPSHVLWETFLEMMGILLHFLHAQREGLWFEYLAEAGRMVPYLVATGHHKYSVYLPLYLKEMATLQENAPEVYFRYTEYGDFTIRRAEGRHNGVSPDMVLEQTYNNDLKQKQGLCGITLNPLARTKYLYTKPITAALSGKLKRMLNLEMRPDNVTMHHDGGLSQIAKDGSAVQCALQKIDESMVNPFTQATAGGLLNISTGELAPTEVCWDLTHVKEIGEKTIKTCLDTGGATLQRVQLKTFDSHTDKTSKGSKSSQKDKPIEVGLLQRVSQVLASGGEV